MKTNAKIREHRAALVAAHKASNTPAETVAALVAQIGQESAAYIIAAMVNAKGEWDGRISSAVRTWAAADEIPTRQQLDDACVWYCDEIHPAHMDQIARAMMEYKPARPAQPAPEPVKPSRVSISPGNNKMGAIPSVSLPPVVTCPRGVPCAAKCYAAKLCRLRPTVREAYARNLEILRTDPAEYWRQVRFAARMARYFRFHVSGDIPGADYLAEMIATAEALPGTDFLAFTKNYTVVNAWIDNGGQLPGNLHLIFFGVGRGRDPESAQPPDGRRHLQGRGAARGLEGLRRQLHQVRVSRRGLLGA